MKIELSTDDADYIHILVRAWRNSLTGTVSERNGIGFKPGDVSSEDWKLRMFVVSLETRLYGAEHTERDINLKQDTGRLNNPHITAKKTL